MASRDFSESEDAYLRAHFDDELSELAAFLGRTESGVRKRITSLGLNRSPRRNDWTPEMDAELARMVSEGVFDAAAAKKLGMSKAGVALRRATLGLVRPNAHRWTEDRFAKLREMAPAGATDAAMAKALGLSEDAVRIKRNELGFRRQRKDAWTEARIAELTRRFDAGEDDHEIARGLGLSVFVVRKRRLVYGLVRSVPVNFLNGQAEAEEQDDEAKDRAFVARLMRDGGLPRAEIRAGFTIWLGPDGLPWFDPDMRRAAA